MKTTFKFSLEYSLCYSFIIAKKDDEEINVKLP